MHELRHRKICNRKNCGKWEVKIWGFIDLMVELSIRRYARIILEGGACENCRTYERILENHHLATIGGAKNRKI